MQTLKALLAKRLAGPFDVAHAILLLTFVASTALPDIEQAAPLLGLASWVPTLLKVGTYVTGALMLLKQFAPAAPAPTQSGSRGFARLGAIALVAALGPAAALVAACQGCSGANGNQVVQDVTIGLNAANCVWQTYSKDVAAGKPETIAIADAALTCGVSVAQAQSHVDGVKLGMVTQGYVLRPPSDAGAE